MEEERPDHRTVQRNSGLGPRSPEGQITHSGLRGTLKLMESSEEEETWCLVQKEKRTEKQRNLQMSDRLSYGKQCLEWESVSGND